MSLRKGLLLVKTFCCKTVTVQSSSYTRSKHLIITANSSRFYSADNIGDKSKNVKDQEKIDILGRFFPQDPVSSDHAKKIQREQEEFEKENKEKTEENEKNWRRTKMGFAIFGGALTVMGGCMIVEMGAPHRDEEGNIIEDEFSDMPTVMQYFRRTWKELTFYERMIKEPSREKLLPDLLPPPYQPTYTLVLEFTDVLVHPDWSYQTGWRFKKRPGVDQFLQTVANSNYEVVIFTSENALMICPVVDKLDPENKFISYRLYRDSTHFMDGVHVKNLDRLNRDLSKVIMVDWNKSATNSHPQNSLILKKWKGADDDTTLLDLANLLQAIVISDVSDVREVLAYYAQFDDPIAAFRDNQRRLLEQMEEQQRAPPPPALTSSWLKPFTRR